MVNFMIKLQQRHRNMSAIGATLATNVLKQGVIINCVTVYGIVLEVVKIYSGTVLKYVCYKF